MGNTPNLKLPFPEGTDAPDIPRDIAALANAIDALMASTSWAPVTYENGWTAYNSSTWGTVQYMKDRAGVVRFKGLMKPASIADIDDDKTAFTLPVGFRPDTATPNHDENIHMASGYTGDRATAQGTTVRVNIHARGKVAIEAIGLVSQSTSGTHTINKHGSAWVAMNSVTFLAEN